MGLHLVALAALHFSLGGATTQLVSNLLWPYLVRVCLSFRVVHQDVVCSSRLFLFQLTQIAMDSIDHNHHHHHDRDHHLHRDHRVSSNRTASNSRNRCRRALRLLRQRVDHIRRVIMGPLPDDQDEDSLHILSMLAL